MKIGFAIIAGDKLVKKIVEIENKYHEEFVFFNKLGLIHNLPHITIFQGEFKSTFDYKSVLDKIAIKYKELFGAISFGKVCYKEKGWYFLEFDHTKEYDLLQEYTIELIRDFIILNPNRFNRDFYNLDEIERNAITNFGYRYASLAYYPHITLGRKESKNDDIIEKLNREFSQLNNKTYASKLTVYKMGENGVHSETLYEIKL